MSPPSIKRTPVDTSAEDRILIGMIISDAYLESVRMLYQPDLMEIPFSRTVASWCIDFFGEYKKAPGLHIQNIFDEKVRSGNLDHASADMIEAFLQRISSEYANAPHFNHEYMLDETEKLFSLRSLHLLRNDLNAALDQGESPNDISEMLREYQGQKIDIRGTAFEEAMMTSTELLAAKIKVPRAILWPWLREGSLTMIYAERGLGKSWLGMIISVSITRQNFEDIQIGRWYIKNPCGVLYLDGEMGNFDLQDRIRQIAEPLGPESKRFPLVTFCAPDFTEKHQETVNLSKPYWQERVTKYLMSHRSIRLIVIDNMASLCPGRDENDNQEVSAFTQWIIAVRCLGVAVIIVHHAGKMGQQRGASALEDPLNNSILLKKPTGWKQGEGAHFHVSFTKARNDPGGEGYRPFVLRVIEHELSSKWRQWIDA